MSTYNVEVEVPGELRDLGYTPDAVREAVPRLLVLQRFREHAISAGKAAELLGLTHLQFFGLLAKEDISAFALADDELSADFITAESLASGCTK